MLPLLMTVLLAIIPVECCVTALVMFGIFIAFCPAICSTLTGFLLAHFTWRALFITVLPLVIITITIAALFLRNVTELSNPSIDIPSIILSSAGFGSFLYGFSIASNEGWTSPLVIGTIGIGAIVIALFVWRQIRL